MQTALSAAAGDVVGVEEGLVLFFLWTRMPTTAPMIMARRRRTESRRMKRRLRVCLRNACSSTGSTLPYPLKDLIVSIKIQCSF